MIDLKKPLIEREPIELIEHTFYSLRLENDIVVQAMEKLQAAGAGLIEIDEWTIAEELEELEEQSIVKLQATAASVGQLVLQAYQQLQIMLESHQGRIKGFASYLELYDVEVADSMKALMDQQA